MKTASPALIAFFAEKRAAHDSTIAWADCFTFTMLDGTTLRYTDADVDVVYSGNTFKSDGPIIEGMKYKAAVGLDVDKQELSITATPNVLVKGTPFMRAFANGAFDLCEFQRDRVFFQDGIGSAVVGGVLLFHGRFLELQDVGRFSALATVADDTIVLGNQMPRNSYSATCNHSLYDAGCALNAESFATATTVGAGSTDRTLKTSAATIGHLGGFVRFTSGAFAGATATVKNVNVGVDVTLMFPLTAAPATGDGFKIYQGCDHTAATCKAKFNNIAKFRGFPFVPPPQYAQ